jgi:hypothetical protein
MSNPQTYPNTQEVAAQPELDEAHPADYARPRFTKLEQAGQWPCVMIDIETLATTEDAVILEIGAVVFDRSRRLVGESYSVTLDYLGQGNRRTDLETVLWWLYPERIARFREIQDGHERKPGLWHGLLELEQFLRVHLAPKGEVWTKGNFDLRILGHAFREHEIEVPWKYYQARELRTVLKWMGVEPATTASHSAVHDARLQVECLFTAEERRMNWQGIDQAAGWMAYRAELADTRAMLLPRWDALHDDVKEAWCAGLDAAVMGTQTGEVA